MSSVLHETESSKGGGLLPIREMHLEIAKFHTSERTQANELSGTFLRAKPINQAMTGRLGLRALRGLISLCCLVSTSALLSLHRDAWHGLRDFCVDGITTPFAPIHWDARAEKVIWKVFWRKSVRETRTHMPICLDILLCRFSIYRILAFISV